MSDDGNVFKSNTHRKAFAFSIAFPVVALVCFFILYRVDAFLGLYLNIIHLWVISGIIGLVVATVVAINSHETTYIVVDDILKVVNGKKEESYKLITFKGTNVQTHLFYGVYSGTRRFIRFGSAPETTVSVEIKLEKDDFNDLVALITMSKRDETCSDEIKDNIRGSFEETRIFKIPKEKITAPLLKERKIRTIISRAVLALTFIICLVTLILTDLRTTISVGIFFILMGPACAFFIYSYRKQETKEALDHTPEEVTVCSDHIAFDERKFMAEDIRRIECTPPLYRSLDGTGYEMGMLEFRSVVVTDKYGFNKKYYIGATPICDKKYVYDSYDQLVKMLNNWCYIHEIDFRNDLG